MRVLHLIHNLEIGGAQVLLKNLIECQFGRSVEPVVAIWKRRGPILDELQATLPDLPVHDLSGGNAVGTVRRLRAVAAAEAVDVVHAHMPDSAFYAGLLARRDLPSVVSYYSNSILFHTIDRRRLYGKLRWKMLDWGARRARANVACALTVRERMVEELALPVDAIDVVFNGVPMPDDAAFEGALSARAARRAAGTAPVVVAVGRLASIKGQIRLVECAPILREILPSARIRIVGEGPMQAEWQARAVALGVDDIVEFTGRVADPARELATADVYVSPSSYEGISLGLLEAMGAGVPVVVSAVEGNVDVVRHGDNGLLFDVDDREALARAIAETVSDPGSADARARRGRDGVLREFSAEAMAAGYEAIYRRLRRD